MITIKNSLKFTQKKMRMGSKHLRQIFQLNINKALKKEMKDKML